MTATISVTRPAETDDATLNRETGLLTVPAAAAVYSGPAHVAPERREPRADEGAKAVRRGMYRVLIPWATPNDEVPDVNDLVTIVSNPDALLVGKVLRVAERPQGGALTASKRLKCEDTADDVQPGVQPE